MDTIYLDYNGTTPILREVADAMLPYLYTHFGNPSSTHPYGQAPAQAVSRARQQVADLLGCRPSEIIFTSGGSESNNHALRGIMEAHRHRGQHLITSAIEHPAILNVAQWLETQGCRVTILPVDEHGQVQPDDLAAALTPETVLVSIMAANNEVGTIQPIAELAAITHAHGAYFHTDAAQAVGKMAVAVDNWGVDLLSIAGHKLYAPKGIGALYVRQGVTLANLMQGAGQENGRRPGTENVLEIVGLGQACAIAQRDLASNLAHFRAMRNRLHEGLVQALGAERVKLNGHPTQRLANTLNLSFRGVEANTLLAAIAPQVAASAGAACHAHSVEVSAVLQAMGMPLEWAMGTVRFSVGRGTTAEEIDTAVALIAAQVKQLYNPTT